MPVWRRALVALLGGLTAAAMVGPLGAWLMLRLDRCVPNDPTTCSDLAPIGALGVGVFAALIAGLWISVSLYQWLGVRFPTVATAHAASSARAL